MSEAPEQNQGAQIDPGFIIESLVEQRDEALNQVAQLRAGLKQNGAVLQKMQEALQAAEEELAELRPQEEEEEAPKPKPRRKSK